MRLVIAGVPRAGKTTLARDLHAKDVRHTDDMKHLEWSEHSEAVAEWFREPGPWIIEGTAAVRAMRKWLRSEATAPCDTVLWMPDPREELTPAQSGMAKGIITIWEEILQQLLDLDVQVESWERK